MLLEINMPNSSRFKRRLWPPFFVLLLFFPTSLWAQFDSFFIDQMIEYQHQGVALNELAQLRAEDIELKRMARKMLRMQKRQIKQLMTWREAYLKKAPLDPNLKILTPVIEGEQHFELNYLEKMIEHHETGLILLKKALILGQRRFIREFAKDRLKDWQKQIKRMEEMKKKFIF